MEGLPRIDIESMKNTVKIEAEHSPLPARKARRGFSLLEVLMVIAVMSCIMAGGYFIIGSTHDVTRTSKLHSDTVAVNNAIRTYLVHGGKIPAAATASDVIAKLKSTADRTSAQRMAGLHSSMVDSRLRGIPATEAGKERAVWNSAKLRFEIKTSGTGFSGFDLFGDPAAPPAEETRQGMLNLGVRDKWVWDSSDGGVTRPVMREVFTANVPQVEAPPPPAITKLASPDVSIPGALYDFSAFNPFLKVSLIDVNTPGTARIFYSIEGGKWMEYLGPLSLPANLTTKIRTYAAAVNGEFYEDSDMRTETYETIYFSGRSTGVFHTPVGDLSLLTNLIGGLKLPLFKWGVAVSSGSGGARKQNSIEFTGDTFTRIAPDQEFKLGTLSYYNGTTQSGTNATAVQFGIDLALTTPGVTESLNYTFKLLSTPNAGKDDDADADYVWIPTVATSFRTIIKGKKFALVLRFGEHSKDGFTTIDTFHAHEGKTLSGTIYGRLTEVR